MYIRGQYLQRFTSVSKERGRKGDTFSSDSIFKNSKIVITNQTSKRCLTPHDCAAGCLLWRIFQGSSWAAVRWQEDPASASLQSDTNRLYQRAVGGPQMSLHYSVFIVQLVLDNSVLSSISSATNKNMASWRQKDCSTQLHNIKMQIQKTSKCPRVKIPYTHPPTSFHADIKYIAQKATYNY